MKKKEIDPLSRPNDFSRSIGIGLLFGLRRRLGKKRWFIGIIFATVLALIGLLVAKPWSADKPIEVAVPHDFDKLEPQLRAYLESKVKWVLQRPKDPQRQATLGMMYAANSLWAEARIAFQNVVRLTPKEPLGHLYSAVSTQEQGNFEEALRQLRNLVTKFPQFAPGHYRLGEALLRAGSAAEAESSFQQLIHLAPGEWRGYAGVGEAKLRQAQYAEAAQFLEKAVRLNPRAKSAHYSLGLAYRGLGRVEKAQRELRLGLNAKQFPMPDGWAATAAQHMKLLPDQIDMAIELCQAGRATNAIDLLEAARKWYPTNLHVLSHLAIAYRQSEQPHKAYPLLLKALKINEKYLSAYVNMTETCLQLGRNAEAMDYAERAAKLFPEAAQVHLARANVLLAIGQDQEAFSAMQSASKNDPQNSIIHMELGDLSLRNLERPYDALEHYEMARKLNPTLLEIHVRLADLHLSLGDSAKAEQALMEARKLEPNEPVISLLERRLRNIKKP